jgi:hypothetical protein
MCFDKHGLVVKEAAICPCLLHDLMPGFVLGSPFCVISQLLIRVAVVVSLCPKTAKLTQAFSVPVIILKAF